MRKRIFLILLLTCLVLVFTSVSANSWNLKGKLLQAMIKTHDWDDYYLLGNQADPFAVMQSRYHHAMFFVDDLDQLTLIYNNGRVTIRGLDFDDEGFSLTNEEGGGGYIPATEDDVQLTEDHG